MQDQITAVLLIQQALTPVFLIVGIGTLLNVLTTRLTRIIDRVRWFDTPEAKHWQHKRQLELTVLSRRMRWANWSINLLCAASVAVCINIFLLIFQGYTHNTIDDWIVISFISIIVLLACGLICFFIEVSLATASLQVVNAPQIEEEKSIKEGSDN